MEKIKYSFLISALLFFFYSCDLDTVPTTSIPEEKVYETLQNTEYVLNGTWAYIWETRNTYAAPGWSTIHLVSDFMGSDVVETGKYGYSDVYKFTTMASGTSVHVVLIWRLAYKAIDNMNNILKYIDDIDSDDETYRNRIKAQAYAFRGYLYLSLASFYADSFAYNPEEPTVPIYIEPTEQQTEGKSRSSLKLVYGRAEEDLLEAYRLIGDYSRSAKYKIDKNVIAGLLARVYLQTGNWGDARKYAAIAHEGYNWMAQDDYLTGFNDLNNAEWIWGQGSATDQSIVSELFDYKDVSSKNGENGYYSMMADPYFMDLFDRNDIRYRLFEWKANVNRSPGYLMYKKFLYKDDSTGDAVLIRKAEMVLIEAEALAEQELTGEAISKLNELREARGANTPDLTGLTAEELVEEILIERRKELFGEGFSLSDIKRRGKSVVRKAYPENQYIEGTEIVKRGHSTLRLPNGTDFVAHSPYYIFSIPSTEYTNNPNL